MSIFVVIEVADKFGDTTCTIQDYYYPSREAAERWIAEHAREEVLTERYGRDPDFGTCPVCDEPLRRCPSGDVCSNGHGY